MILSLIGMSGVGKSHHAQALKDRGFVHHDIDAAIAERIGDLCAPLPGERPVETVGRWMGMPWMPGRAEREAEYLALEAELTETALDAFDAGDQVIDTTGSVIYLPAPLLERLQQRTQVLYLRTATEDVERMLARYLAEPKPVVWGSSWQPFDGEENGAALRRCYPLLLKERSQRYQALASRILDGAGLSTEDLFAALR